MKRSNTAIILILRAFMIPHRIENGIVEVQAKDCVKGNLPDSNSWIKVPDIVSAMWVTGALA